MKLIRSRANPLFLTLRKLRDSAQERREAGRTVLDGPHLVAAYLDHGGAPDTVIVSEEARQTPEIGALLARVPEPVIFTPALFREAAPVMSPAGILAIVPIGQSETAPRNADVCVLLEDVQDPGNLGTLLRTAAAAGVIHVLLSKGCVDAWAPRVLRAAMGAHHALKIECRADLASFARRYAGQVLAADATAPRSIYDVDLTAPTAFAFGNEGAGLSAALRKAAHVRAAVPIAPGVESINVAAAAAVCLFERVRQRGAAAWSQ